MKILKYSDIVENVSLLCTKAAFDLPEDVEKAIKKAIETEESPRGLSILKQYLENSSIAAEKRVPICQDTGISIFFVKMGSGVKIEGGELYDAINEGTSRGYREGYLRKSIVRDPLFNRINTKDNTPAVIHLSLVPGEDLEITLAPKGAGSENMSKAAMLKPSDGKKGVIDFVTKTVISAGGNPCPPTIVGVGIGGSFEKTALLAKKALLRKTGEPHPDREYAELEKEILERINESGIGPQGLGGRTTAFAVHIETFPCHIASLPVAVNMNCHAARHSKIIL